MGLEGPPLVVRHRLEGPLAENRVFLHHLVFLGRELAGLQQDRIGNADLAHVVQRRRMLDQLDQVLGSSSSFRAMMPA